MNYWDDLDADFLRFYRIDLTQADPVAPARFFALACRLPAYEGVLSVRLQQEQEEAKAHNPSRAVREEGAQVVDLSAMSEFVEMK